MSNAIQIRQVTPEDYQAWLPLWIAYNAFYGRSGDTALTCEITQLTWSRFFDENELMYAIIAEYGGQLIGLAHYLFHRSTILAERTCYLQDLYVSESERGRGVGHALINKVYEEAKSADAKRVYWQTHENNFNAMRLYDGVAERSGFIVYRKIF